MKHLVTLLLTALSLSTAACREAGFTVSPDGDDANPGTAAGPFRTIRRAMRAVRERRAQKPDPGPLTVYLRAGRYELTEPLAFGPADAGTADAPVTYASFPGERACISGGRRIEGPWRKTPGKPYCQAAVPGAKDGKWVFNALYVNGSSRTRARTPNRGQKVFRAAGRAPGEDPKEAFVYRPGDIDPSWTNPTDIDIVLLCSWTPTIHRIEEILPGRRVVRFHSAHNRAVDFWERNFRYYLANVLEGLDEPGEWYLDRKTGTLYYYPLPGEDMARADVIAPVLTSRLVTFRGNVADGQFIEHLRFRDLDFRHVDGDLDRYNGVYRQGHMFLDAALYAEGLRSTTFYNCAIAQVGEYAVEMGAGCRDNRIEHCHIRDIGAGAAQIGISSLKALLEKRKEAPRDEDGRSAADVRSIVVDNNCIHRLGTMWHGCYGIVNRFASLTRITHNDIFDTHWDPIGLDARWHWKGEKYSHGNVVAYNHIHHYGLRYHTDCGAIYQFGPLDTHIHHNRIHHGRAYPYICGAAGVYLDQQSRGAVVENNLVHTVEWYAYFQHLGTDNVFRNNIGAFARDGLIRRGGLNRRRENYMEACRNIYIADDDIALRHAWRPGKRPPMLRNNMYYTLAPDTHLTFAGKKFAAWQAEGHDAGSVIGDPGCADPAGFDFSLPAGAAAVNTIGFAPFDADIAKAGLRGDAAWRGLPARQERRAPSATWSPADLAKLVAFAMDFEDMPPGYEPPAFRLAKEGKATFAVSTAAARGGKKSLRCVDRKDLKKGFYPYIHVAPRKLETGRITFAFDAMLDRAHPAPFSVQFRGRGSTKDVGPDLRVARDGTVTANGRTVFVAAPGTWFRIAIAFQLGADAPKEYRLTARCGDTEKRMTVPFRHETFSVFRWLGITAPGKVDGVFYLDNMALDIE